MIYNGNISKTGPLPANAIYSTGTYTAGPSPCSLVVSPTSFSIIAANKAVVFTSTVQG